jgi:hypothetical protein
MKRRKKSGRRREQRAGELHHDGSNISRLDPRDKFLRAAHGALELTVVGPREMLGLTMRSASGDAEATRLAKAVAQALGAAMEGEILCLNPDHEVGFGPKRMPALFVVVTPFAVDLKMCLTNALCGECAARADVREIILRAWRRVMPDLQVREWRAAS